MASKYMNRKTTVDGLSFDSAKEARRWQELRILERGGLISALGRQRRYKLIVEGSLVCTYVSDFDYVENGVEVTEDVKSEYTRKMPVYRIKFKLFRALFGRAIREV